MKLVDKTSPQRVRGELGPIDGDVVADVGPEPPHYVGIERALDPRPDAAPMAEAKILGSCDSCVLAD